MFISKYTKIVAVILILSITSACMKDDTNGVCNRPIAFYAKLAEPLTMAPIESNDEELVTSGDVTGIQMLRGTNGASPAFNALTTPTTTATLDGLGVLTPAMEMKLNTDGSEAHFMAYYPEATTYVPDASNKLKIGWTIDGSQDLIASAPVTKKITTGGDSAVTLHFDHLLARIELKVKAYNQANLNFYKGIEEAYIVIPNKIELQVAADGSSQSYCTSQPDKDEDWTTASFGNVALTLSDNTSASYVMLWPDAGRIRNGELCIRFKGLPNVVQHYSISDLKLEAGKTTRVNVTVGNGVEPAPVAYYGTANCYEVHAAGSYLFDTTPYSTTADTYPYHNFMSEGLPIPRSAAMLWSDVSSNHLSNISVTDNGGGSSYTLHFDCNGVVGNAVIAVYDNEDPLADDAKILWSYHIWVNNRSEDDDQSWSVINTTTRTIVPNKYYMMDRNLGATSNNMVSLTDNSAYGLFYQWGRKDPFVGAVSTKSATRKTQYVPTSSIPSGELTPTYVVSSAVTGKVEYSIEHPTTFIVRADSSGDDWLWGARDNALWGNPTTSTTHNYYPRTIGRKSIYDPCPQGYCVPPQDAFTLILKPEKFVVRSNGIDAIISGWNSASANFGLAFYYEGVGIGRTAYLPWAGVIHRSTNNLASIGTEGLYWTNTNLNSENKNAATRVSFNNSTWNCLWGGGRAMGQSVRCMREIKQEKCTEVFIRQ